MKRRALMPGSAIRMATLAIALMVPTLAPVAGAGVGAMIIQGTVTDPLARPLANVGVDDGQGNLVFTDATGRYRIDETWPSTFQVTAARGGLNPQTKTVTPTDALSPVDFQLTYVLTASVSPPAASNAVPPTVLSVSATSYAPATGQCVTFTDLASGDKVALTFEPPAAIDGATKWTGSYQVPASRADGDYGWDVKGTDCGATTLTNVRASSYVLDSLIPTLDHTTLFPPAEGNTVIDNQRLVVTLRDERSGVAADSVQFTIAPRGGLAVPQAVESRRWLDSATLRVTSVPTALAPDGRYTATVRAHDKAGNLFEHSWNFRRLTFSVGQANAEIESSIGKAKANDVWAFLPRLRIGRFQVGSGEPEHGGFGPVGQRVDLSTARIEFDLAGVHMISDVKPYPVGKTITVYKQFLKLKAQGADTKTLYGQTVHLEPISVQLPAGAQNAVLRMDLVKSTPYVPASDCPTPDALVAACTPDPLRFFLPEDFATRMYNAKEDIIRDRINTTPAPESGSEALLIPHLTETPMFLIRLLPEVYQAGQLVSAMHWTPVTLDRSVVTTGWDEEVLGFIGGILYPTNLPPLAPIQFQEACEAGYPCIGTTAAAGAPFCGGGNGGAACNTDLQRACVILDGYDRRFGGDKCNQLVGIVDFQTPYTRGINRLRAAFVLQLGSADAVSVFTDDPYGPIPNPFDEFGWAWKSHDGSTINWSWAGDSRSWSAVRYDYYYCDGDENKVFMDSNQTMGPPPHFHWIEDSPAQADVSPQLEPALGFKHPNFRQYRLTKDSCGGPCSGNLLANECAGWYDPDDKESPGFRHFHRRYPLGRGWLPYMDSEWNNTRAGDKGTATMTWGHIWTRFTYRFEVSFSPGFGCGPGGSSGVSCGPDFVGFSIKPHEETKEAQAFYRVDWCYGRSDC